jgi:hypothetical protein
VGPPEEELVDGSLVGQWTGPWNLELVINPALSQGAPFNDPDRDWAEIAHMVVLPPREAGDKTLVLVVCRRLDGASVGGHGGDVPSVSFLLDPDDPLALQTLVVNGLPGPTGMGAKDPFCGSHVLTAAGDVFWVGGTDVVAEAADPAFQPWGHAQTYLLVRQPDPLGWQWQDAGTMGDPRWYGSVTTLRDGSKAIWGHAANPVSIPPADTTREYVTITGTTAVWSTPGVTLVNERLAGCNPTPPSLSLGEFPHLHVVRNERVLWTGMDVPSVPATDALFDLDACGGTAERFVDDLNVGEPHPQTAGLNSVHLINLARNPDVEVVYALGGAVHDAPVPEISGQVVRMIDPDDGTEWDDSPPDLNAGVINANTVILLDGSIVRFGGYGWDEASQTYLARLRPERYKPPEVFASPSTGWDVMQKARHERRYHSTAVLLQDGRVIVGGGDDVSEYGVVEPSWYSVEIFNPTYMFNYPRPRITAAPTQIGYGVAFQFSAILRTTSTAGEFRVALVGPGSATHAVDFSQRYVVLDVNLQASIISSDPNLPSTLSVTAPPDDWTAPPGWYLLTVVNSQGMPAAARWVQVGL